MFGKVLSIDGNKVVVENLKKENVANLINIHVAFDEEARTIIGEIINMNESEISIFLVGEIRNGDFYSGINRKPSFIKSARIIYKNELELILGNQNINDKNYLYIGKSNIYENYSISANTNDFFSSHFAILGNSGAGKSCGVARILQNIFYQNNETSMPVNASLVLFDYFGEYNNAFNKMNEYPKLGFKNYTTNTESNLEDTVKIPAYFLDVDDLAILLSVNDPSQLPIIEEALKFVYIFNSKDETVIEYKNDIIAKAVLDILQSGKQPTQIRDQIIAVLINYNTEKLNLDTIIPQPGYNRTIKQCLNLDAQGKINAVGAVVDFLSQYVKVDINNIVVQEGSAYNLKDLAYALDFALISEGTLNNKVLYEKTSVLKVRLQSIIKSNHEDFFNYEGFITKESYIKQLFTCSDGKKAQIINMNFNYIDERFAKILTKLFCKLFYDYTTTLSTRASFPIHIVLEEAHRYVQNDTDIDIIGYNIFDRITKEGRKYGVILGFITQRPSELSTTSLSQCSNFIVFRMYHPEDIKIVCSMSSNVTMETLEKIKSLRPGSALTFGTAFKLPLIVNIELPNPMPQSTSVNIVNSWYEKN